MLEYAQASPAANQHGDIAEARQAITRTVADSPGNWPSDGSLHERGDVCCLGARRVFCRVVIELRPTRHAQHHDAGSVAGAVGRPLRIQLRVGNLMVALSRIIDLRESSGQHRIDPCAHIGSGATVDRQLLTCSIHCQQAREQFDIGVAETVDRLLRIPDGEQRRRCAAGSARRELGDDVELHLVSVLELVDKQIAVARANLVTDVGPGLQQAA